MEIVLLGSGSADGWPNPFCGCPSCRAAAAAGVLRGPTAAMVDDVLLLDCGPEAPRGALRAGRSLAGVTDLLLTHSHPDHTSPEALLWRRWAGVETPLTVHGPAPALDLCRDWVGRSDPVTFHPIEAGNVWRTAHHTVRALAANHGDPPADPAVLWDVTDGDGRRLLWATDTGWPPAETLRWLTQAPPYDVVFVEETFGDRSDLADDHLNLASFASLVAKMREAGTISTSTQVVAVHLGHSNPPPDVLDARLAALAASAGRDGDVIHAPKISTPGISTPGISTPRASTPRISTPSTHPAPSLNSQLLILGGARSGKSQAAERLLADHEHVTYVATGGRGHDDLEWQRRIEAHRRRRPPAWETVETTDLEPVLARATADEALLVDCLTLWLTERMDAAGCWDSSSDISAERLRGEIDRFLLALRTTRATVVLVSNEVGQGVVPATTSGREFRDALGALNTAVAAAVDSVVLMVAGQPIRLKGSAPIQAVSSRDQAPAS